MSTLLNFLPEKGRRKFNMLNSDEYMKAIQQRWYKYKRTNTAKYKFISGIVLKNKSSGNKQVQENWPKAYIRSDWTNYKSGTGRIK